MSISMEPGSPVGERLMAWWQRMEEDHGLRAEVRRCSTVQEVLLLPAFARFRHELGPHMTGEWNWETRMAAVFGLLSHVKAQVSASLPEQMAETAGGAPRLSELRFRRLLQADRGALYVALLRVLRLLKGQADIRGLAKAVYDWNDRVKREWAYSYFPRVPDKRARA